MRPPSLIVVLLLVTSLTTAFATDYYIDPSGNDLNSGTSTSTAWQSIAKVNASTFSPGDNILCKRGGTWTGQLHPLGSGNSTSQITLGAYGTGAKPLIDGAGSYAAIYLNSQEYWTIDGFEVTNWAATEANRSGIRVDTFGSGTTHRIRILNNDVHDIRGLRNVNDGGRNNGGIYLTINEPGKANDVLIQGNTVTTVNGQGITFWGESEFVGTMDYTNCSPSVVVRGNKILITSGDGLLLLGTDNELAERNEVGFVGQLSDNDNNIAAAWPTRHINGIWQYNYVHDTVDRGNDSTAFDNDGFLTGTTCFQYNYSYNNQGGFFMEYTWGGDVAGCKSVVRYNISVNESRIVATNRSGAEFYNNVFYNPGATIGVEWTAADTRVNFRNNIFVAAGRTTEFGSQTFFYNTFNGGITRPTTANNNTTRDPLFVSPNSTGNLAGFILQSTSPERSTGQAIASNGGKDFWGASVPASPSVPHRGASQIASISSYAATPTYLYVTGPLTAYVPTIGSYNMAFSNEVRDQNYRVISSPAVTWSISPAVGGLSINSSGTLSIASTAVPQRFAVVATSGSLTRSLSVSLVNASSVSLSWNNGAGTGKWNAADANWTGNAWIEGAQATFSHTATPQTVTIEGTRSAAAVLVGNGGNNANYTFTSASGGALSASSFLLQGNAGNDDTNEPAASFNNAAINVSGNLGIGRARLSVGGTSVINAATIGGGGIATSADWGYLTLSGSATVTATDGVNGNTAAWGVNLNGGTLTTSGIQASDSNFHGAYLYFNGTTVRADRDAYSFVTLSNGLKAYIGAGGAVIDTNGCNIGIGVILADASSASPSSNGGTTLSGAGFLHKQGAGTLTLAGTNTYTGATLISGGTLKLAPAPLVPVPGMARWFDASNLNVANGAGVSQWNDLSGNNANAAVPGGNGTPTYIADAGTGTGMGALNFTAGSGAHPANNSQALTYSRDTNVRSYFSVFQGASFLATDTQDYALARGEDDINPAAPLLTNYGQINYLGSVYVNGTAVNPTGDAMPTGLHNGFNQVSLITNGNAFALNGFNKDRDAHSGNQSQAEVLIYDFVLTEEQRLANERYLNYKWFGILSGSTSGPVLPRATAVTLSNGGILDLNGVRQTVGSLSGTDASGTQIKLGSGALTVGNAANTIFDGVIGGNGGSLVKQGGGTLTLTGSNTYTGNTTVNAGTLRLGNGTQNTSLADSSDLIVAPGGMLYLNYAGTDVIDELWLDGQQMPPGVYSSSRSGFITGPGTLTVANGPSANTFVTWAGRGGYNLSSGPSGDDDHDGIVNLLEYVLGANPLAQTSSAVLPAAGFEPGNFVFRFTRVHASTVDTNLTFQYSTGLITWTDVPVTTAGGMVSIQSDTPTPGIDTVTVTVPTGSNPRMFGRLKVVKP